MITIKCREGTIDRYSLFVQFSYNAYYIEAIKSMPMRKWHPIEKMWEVPVDQLQNLLELFEKQDIEISGTYLDMTPVTEIDYKFKTEPYEHQREGFLYGLNHHKWFLGDEQGLGKTKQVIDIACALKEKEHYQHCLIICGVNSLKWNWQREVSIHSNEESHIIGQRIKKRTGEIVIGSSKDKIYDLKNLDDISAYFLITNVESLRNADISAELVSLISKRKIELVAVDEIHKCLGYDTLINTESGYMKIGDIVTNKIDVRVWSNSNNGPELKRILNRYENLVLTKMLRLTINTNSGIKTIECTPNHLIATQNRGWIQAQYITEDDEILEY